MPIIPHTTRSPGTILTAAIYNEDHERHVANAAGLIQDAIDASAGADEARDKAQEWAENPEDVEVEPDQFSALHHATKASASAAAAATSETNAVIAETNSGINADAAALSAADAAAAKDDAEAAASAADTDKNDAAASAAAAGTHASDAEGFRDEAEIFRDEAAAAVGGAVPRDYNTKASVEAADVPLALDFIRIAGFSSTGDGGGAPYKRVASEPSHGGKIQSADGAWWENAASVITSAMLGGDADAAAAVAFALGRPLRITGAEKATLIVDPTGDAAENTNVARFDVLKAAWLWAQTCQVAGSGTTSDGGGRPILQLANGLHVLEGHLFHSGNAGSIMDLRGSGTDFRTITGITFATVDAGAGIFAANVTMSEELPAHVVVGYPVGLQNVRGNGDAEVVNGAMTITAINGPRTQFTGRFHYHRTGGLSHATTIDSTGSDKGLERSRVVIPRAAISAADGWDGGAIEGFINLTHSGYLQLRNIGISYAGTQPLQCLIMLRDLRTTLDLFDRVVLAGAANGRFLVRLFGHSTMWANRCYFGSDGKSPIICQIQNGGYGNLSRCCVGGGSGPTVSVSGGSNMDILTNIFAGGNRLIETIGGGKVRVGNTEFKYALTALRARDGDIIGDSNTTFLNNDVDISWDAHGFVHGLMSESAKVRDDAGPNRLWRGGGWYRDATGVNAGLGPKGFSRLLTILNNDVAAIPTGHSGGESFIAIFAANLVGNGFPNGIAFIRVGTSSAVNLFGLERTTNIATSTAILTGTTGTSGNFTISANTNGTIYLENRTGSTKVVRITLLGI